MVQVLPYVPSFLERLTPYLQKAASDIGQGLEQRSAMKALEKYYQQKTGQSFNGEDQPATQSNEPSVGEALAVSRLAEKALGKDRSKEILSHELSQIREVENEKRKEAAAKKKQFHEKKEHQGNIQKTFNVASSLLAKNTPGVGISPGAATGLSRKAVEGRNTFNTLKGKFESILLPMVNKGTLAKERFNFILSQIPDAGDSQRAIAGKLRGLAETLSEEGFPIDTKVLDSIPWVSEELKGLGQESQQERPSLESFVR